ncbi:MAG TPA: redoxin domain-containing protein [Chloroflexia bacterium]|nr:redoxin domain-containing protein [Chloroflexia bacterium]
MHLEAGAFAPDFATQDIFGNVIRLEDFRGKTLLLSYFRNAACAICNLRVHQMIQRYATWKEHGLEVLAVFESPDESMRQYVAKQDAPFPLIADPQALLYKLYGVESSEDKVNITTQMAETEGMIESAAEAGFNLTREEGSNFYRIPADFLIGPDLRLKKAHYGEFVYDHMSFDEIEQLAGLTVVK